MVDQGTLSGPLPVAGGELHSLVKMCQALFIEEPAAAGDGEKRADAWALRGSSPFLAWEGYGADSPWAVSAAQPLSERGHQANQRSES